MADTGRKQHDTGLLARLTRTRAATRIAIYVERLWPLVLPFLVVISLFLSLSWLGVFRVMPDWLRLLTAILLAAAAAASLYPLRFFRRPLAGEIDRRIERANDLRHAPVLTQTDKLSSTSQDIFAQALWREHQKRMAEGLGRLSSDLPRTRVPERDPWGLRAAAALLLVVAFAFSFGPLGGRLNDAFRAHARADIVPPRIDAWVTPPPYTGKAPLFLTADANREAPVFRVPAGSDVAVRVTGGAGDETLSYLDAHTGEEQAFEPAAASAASERERRTARQFAGKLEADGMLSLKSEGAEVQHWAFNVIPDNPPEIRFADEPKRAVNGALELNYEVEDDYGPASARGEITQAEQPAPGARALYEAPELPLTLPRRNGRDIAARTVRDLTEHPWAGSVVDLTLKAVDAAEQEAASETKTFVLPERPFVNPIARAVVEQRRLLALDANSKAHVLDLMDAVTLRPDDTFENMSHYLGIMSARSRLEMAQSDEALREVVDYLWEIALTIEDGSLSDAERRLQQAQQALQQALQDGAGDEEIERLMQELREAMRDFMREFAERAMRNPDSAMQMPQNGQELRQSDLERMMDQIENLARSGARDQAQELLSQLQDMMNNLQAGRQQQQQQGQGQQSEMRQQMDRLGELMRRQQEMMNETFRLDQMQRGQQQFGDQFGDQQFGEQQQPGEGQQGQGQQGQGQQGQGQQMSPEELAEALRQLQEGQSQLQQELDELTRGLQGMGIQPGEGFDDAGRAMGRAGEALGEAQGERAVGEQGQALEALRRGAQDMMQQMQAQQGEQGGAQEGGRQQSSDRDPLGRPRATTGPDFGDSVKVPDEIDVQRARRILDAIRERLGNALSPELERNYLERLLEMR
ncbi:TIGR02302 family protein [Aquamicrobium sp. LC103]|uniref:TIGR02302 family protein n=1 Tax=Aquamicrobium sp. LC103 TaxID=1120658 RepID=UPI00063E8EED|nr:TIGR02302 family protein [Aquamicrobium sp. LC103]TKT75271.1 TIGR02302 family protein [Aquamicrobium sp. LC103]